MAISKAVIDYAQQHGYRFYVQSLGYRKLVEILDTDNKHIGWTSNKSDCARNSINSLINQKRLAAKSDAAIATEAEQAIQDLTPATPAICSVEADAAYQVLQPVAPERRRYYERTSYMGVGVEVYCGDSRYGYALAELLDRPIEVDYTVERQRMDRMMDRDCDHVSGFAMSARYGCGALI
jgi:hypothetical protein